MLVHAVERDWSDGIWVITLEGEFTRADHGTLRQAVAKCLADAPATIILDLHRVGSADRLLPNALATEERRAEREDVALVCVLNEELAATVRRAPIARFLTIYPTVQAARALVADAPTRRWLHLTVGDHPSAVVQCLNEVGAACRAWGIWNVQDEVQNITTELVGNAIEHTGGRAEVTLAFRRGLVRIGVHDPGGRLLLPPANGDASAHGLGRVAAYANAWGVHKTVGGKLVWATVRVQRDW
ncbi:MAG: hypothetical protein HOV83_25540 [Catenulispora sp.]|nr:hypothetical protein [Catenulispora sp.]